MCCVPGTVLRDAHSISMWCCVVGAFVVPISQKRKLSQPGLELRIIIFHMLSLFHNLFKIPEPALTCWAGLGCKCFPCHRGTVRRKGGIHGPCSLSLG